MSRHGGMTSGAGRYCHPAPRRIQLSRRDARGSDLSIRLGGRVPLHPPPAAGHSLDPADLLRWAGHRLHHRHRLRADAHQPIAPAAPAGHRLHRGVPRHPHPGAGAVHLLWPAPAARRPHQRPDRRHRRHRGQLRCLHLRGGARRGAVHRARPARGLAVAGALTHPGLPLRDLAPGLPPHDPAAGQPGHHQHQGHLAVLGDRRRRAGSPGADLHRHHLHRPGGLLHGGADVPGHHLEPVRQLEIRGLVGQ